MRKVLNYLMGGCLLAAACTPSQKPEITGELTGLNTDTLLVRSFPFGARDVSQMKMDTIVAKDGKFTLSMTDSVPRLVNIYQKPSMTPNPDGSMPAMSMAAVGFMLVPQNPLTVTGTIEDYTLGGSPVYEDYAGVEAQTKVFSAKVDSIMKICQEMSQNKVSRDSIAAVYEQIGTIGEEMNQVKIDYIKQHPDKDASLLLLSELQTEEMGELIDLISEPVRTGALSSVYTVLKEQHDKAMAREKAKELVKDGAQAPDFTLKDINGKDFTLSSLKGKYVVLDFWGSWCGWCIKGMPDMKKAYAKYKNKMEIVGIDCNDTEEKWKAAVKEHELPWTHVRNDEATDVSVMYAIQGYPTKVIIDKEGKIVKTVIGEDPAFYTFLDKLLK